MSSQQLLHKLKFFNITPLVVSGEDTATAFTINHLSEEETKARNTFIDSLEILTHVNQRTSRGYIVIYHKDSDSYIKSHQIFGSFRNSEWRLLDGDFRNEMEAFRKMIKFFNVNPNNN